MVGFNAVLTSEHFGAFLTFGVLHAALAIRYIKVRSLLHRKWVQQEGCVRRSGVHAGNMSAANLHRRRSTGWQLVSQNMLSPRMYGKAKATLLVSMLVATTAVVVAVVGYVMASPTFGWTGAALELRGCPRTCSAAVQL